MLAPPTFPKWLPTEVAIEADRIISAGTADDDLVIRLATDKRMEWVWRVLKKCDQVSDRPQLSDAWTLMNAVMGEVDVRLPEDNPDALSLFFWCAYTIASLKPKAGTFSRFDLPIAEYKREAANLRLSAATLRRLDFQYSAWGQSLAHRYIKQIEKAANYCDTYAALLTNLKVAQAPLVIERNYGNQEARGYVRMLAVETRKLFGMTARRTLARVASVALMKEVTNIQVRKWCDSLDDA
jgi:hypothetical protein